MAIRCPKEWDMDGDAGVELLERGVASWKETGKVSERGRSSKMTEQRMLLYRRYQMGMSERLSRE